MILIDKEQAYQTLSEYYHHAGTLQHMALREALDRVPAVDAVPVRHGKWMVTPVYIKCSECGESFMLIPQNYCPNCGARMDEE